jgi:hypothetical protein
MWKGLQSSMDYKGRPSHYLPNDASQPDELNAFYARFDNTNNTVLCVRAPTNPEDWVISLSKADVSKVFNQVNTRKATGPESIPGHVLRALTHLDKRNTYVRMLFIDYSSAFNTILPSKLITKLRTLGPGTEHLPLQLDPGLHDGPTPGGKGRQHQLCHTDAQHVGPTSLCA